MFARYGSGIVRFFKTKNLHFRKNKNVSKGIYFQGQRKKISGECCIFRKGFGCCTLGKLVKICFKNCAKKLKKGRKSKKFVVMVKT